MEIGITFVREARTGRFPPDGYPQFDVVIIGSGFGGSVSALRLREKGYSVAVLEAGRRFNEATYAKNSWDLKNFLWAPALGFFGIQRIHVLKDVAILAGAGVGGGSLVYANTLYVPGERFFSDLQWSGITDWKKELAPFYDQASRMLGVELNPTMTPSDKVMQEVASSMGVGHTFTLTPVGVFLARGEERLPLTRTSGEWDRNAPGALSAVNA